jgi:uncharacterized membrane-anchored protein
MSLSPRKAAASKATSFSRSQRMTIVSGIMLLVLLLVILQLWLFMATMEAYLGGNDNIVIPALIASVVCLLLNFGLFHYLRNLDR